MNVPWIVGIVFFAAVLQALTGFGFSLVVMPLATLVIDLKTAAPLIALAALTACTVNIIRLHQAVDRAEVAPLALASMLGIPIGIWVQMRVDELTINRIMGAILLAYAVYSLLQPTAPRRLMRGWAYVAGFLSGCLGAAYNTAGPPVAVYGALRQWAKDEYRATLQAVFVINGVMVVSAHLVARHMTSLVWTLYAWAAPALLLGLYVGRRLDRQVDQKRFRTLVAVTILALGISQMLGLGRG